MTGTRRSKESLTQRRGRVARILSVLADTFPDAHCELDHRTPFELLAATILSAQCTDKRVNLVTPALFARFPTPEALAAASLDEVEALVKTTGFFRNKAKNLVGMATALVVDHGGTVPMELDALVRLPGVGRKTANVLLGEFATAEGVVVDTHVGRIARRLGLTASSNPEIVERALMQLVPQPQWAILSHLLIWHGRRTCDARKPACERCPIANDCPTGPDGAALSGARAPTGPRAG